MAFRILLTGMSAAVLLLGTGTGCVRESGGGGEPDGGERIGGLVELPEYPPLEHYELELTLPQRLIYVGDGGKLNFKLTNVGKEPVRIIEWYSNESDNVLVYCQPWLPGQDAPDEEMWIALTFDINHPAPRYALELKPGNSVLVEKVLPFIDKLHIEPGSERRFFLKAELNLESVKVQSPLMGIRVRRPEPGGAGNGSATSARPE